LVQLEVTWHLTLIVCGDDLDAKRTFINARSQIRNRKITLQDGVQSWYDRILQLQKYLEYTTWKAGWELGNFPAAYPEIELREILHTSMTDHHKAHLKEQNWDTMEKNVEETVAKLKHFEPKIIETLALKKDIREVQIANDITLTHKRV